MENKLKKLSASEVGENEFISKSGYNICFDDEVWHLDKNRSVSFKAIKSLLRRNVVFESFKCVMQFYTKNYSSAHCANMNAHFTSFLKESAQENIDTNALINFRDFLGTDREYILGSLAGFLKKWNELGYEGVPDEVVDLLYSWRLKGNVKGDVVKRLDPEQGPLTDIELQSINEAAASLYEENKITIDKFAMVRLLSATGRRPIQLSHMKLKDVMSESNKNQEMTCVLNIPRAKQRGIGFREAFKQMQITEDLWRILDLQRANVITQFEEKFGQINDKLILELPLFPSYYNIQNYNTIPELVEALQMDTLHCARELLSKAAEAVVQKAKVMSERTDAIISINAQRFRYSVGTRAAREGYGPLVIAELLDHTDTQNAAVYVENIPEYARKINDKVGHLLVPYANAFRGIIVNDENEARRGSDQASRIKLNPHENIGTCGSYDFCGSRVPIPCYTCNHFQPWLDAPHEKVLQELIDERERVYQQTNDLAIASINDRTIIAVTEVVKLCKERREEMKHG